MSNTPEIASRSRYERVWRRALERQDAEVTAAIAEAKARHGEAINCAFLHRFLKLRFPFATAWISPDHVMTEIGGVLYDKDGRQLQRAALGDDMQLLGKSFRWPLINDLPPEDQS